MKTTLLMHEEKYDGSAPVASWSFGIDSHRFFCEEAFQAISATGCYIGCSFCYLIWAEDPTSFRCWGKRCVRRSLAGGMEDFKSGSLQRGWKRPYILTLSCSKS